MSLQRKVIRHHKEGYKPYATGIHVHRNFQLASLRRQRIAIARAIIRDAPILILDEPATGLDAASESLVLSALKNPMAGRTCIINAHRLATVRRADTIFVLQHGMVVEQGTHQCLLARGGLYSMLYEIQFRREERDGEERYVG
jgi:ABC-type multidrug transport system fused ATPase/permease subunit